MTKNAKIEKRYDFVYLFDVQDGNPNGDPDAGNMPRVDPETGTGLVTDVSLKRKVRNFVQMTQYQAGYDIFIKERGVLNNLIDEAYEQDVVKENKGADKIEQARQFMCDKYYDVRTFGAVMSTGKNAGQVRGPVQLTFSRSMHPIITLEHSITRMAVASEKEIKVNEETGEENYTENRTMGRKYTVPYGLYRCHGFVSAHFAESTGFTQDDLEVFWQSLINMFDHDHSAARGQMNARGLYVFEHDNKLGNAPAHKLFDLVKVEVKDASKPIRAFSDYNVQVDANGLPDGVSLDRKI
ncbi:type I-C CRISPR-associated protein Cas7/Csd2 [uncultured Psychrobacter sp.]|uniref:type I-C CRISPR-associated protein Cas7/Csd2 n=1 Tax=uncultured Psychrobacter sp. TaxID=259303 RepID=UPI002613C9A1|nr:type I-C CRISPR-associated protein Cas7/Csd2 [uncultured Psychrobacter sp.]